MSSTWRDVSHLEIVRNRHYHVIKSTLQTATTNLCRLTGLLYRRVEPALGTSGGIAVDDIASGSLVELFARQTEFALRLLLVTCGHRFAHTFYRTTHGTADTAVSETADFVLTESFLGALGIWHVFGSEIRVLPRWRLQKMLVSRPSFARE